MKESIKSTLYSALVLPGAGHLYLKRYVLGALLAFGALVATYFIVSNVMQGILKMAANIQAGGVPPEFGDIMALLTQQSAAGDGSTSSSLIALLVLWVIGVVDSYRIGHALDKSNASLEKLSQTDTK